MKLLPTLLLCPAHSMAIAAAMICCGLPLTARTASQASPATLTNRYVGVNNGTPLPRRLVSRAQAEGIGCQFGKLKSPDADSCILGTYAEGSFKLSIYDPLPDGAYAVANELAIPSQHQESTLSLASMPGQRTDWLLVETTGMHGTAIGQRVLFVIAWNGDRFRAVAAESLDYHCSRPTSPADYALRVRHALRPLANAAGLVLDYELQKNGRVVGKWSHQLRWNAFESRLMPSQSKVEMQADPAIHHVLAQIEHVRVYSASGPMDPAGDAARWMSRSELMDVLAPACSPSMLYVARDFSGKWMVDHQRTSAASAAGAPAEESMVIGVDRQGMHFWHREGNSQTASIEHVYRLDGKEAAISSLTSGKSAQGKAVAALDGEKIIVTIKAEDQQETLRRVFYRDGANLVIEDSGSSRKKSVTYFLKM